MSSWISSFGVQSQITTNRGQQFNASFFHELSGILGTYIRTTCYHPSSNSMVGCLHMLLKSSLRAFSDPRFWTEFLPLIVLGCCTAIKSDLGYSAAELLYSPPWYFLALWLHRRSHPFLIRCCALPGFGPIFSIYRLCLHGIL